MRANESDFPIVNSPRRRRRLAGTGFFAVAAALVPAQCKPAPAPAPLPIYTPPAASSSGPAPTATTATTTATTLVASAGPVPTPAVTAEPATTATTDKTAYPPEPTATTAAPAPGPTTTTNGTTAGTTAPPARTCAGPAAATGTNLLTNPSFEEGGPLATGWLDESTTFGAAMYSISTTDGVVDGSRAQVLTYVGVPDDDGSRKSQFYQAPIRGVAAGQRVQFSICVTAAGTGPASLVRSYAAIGVEAFRADRSYISDVATNITRLDATPTRYVVDYVVPEGTDYLAVFIQSPEVYWSSVFDIVFDQASLVVLP